MTLTQQLSATSRHIVPVSTRPPTRRFALSIWYVIWNAGAQLNSIFGAFYYYALEAGMSASLLTDVIIRCI